VDVDVWVGCGTSVDLEISLLLDRRDDDLKAMRARGVEEEEGEASVAGDEAEFIHVQSIPKKSIAPSS
jgi:hypothetical protein